MNLTKKEMEVMQVLWNRKAPMTASEIIEASVERTWSEQSLYAMLNRMVDKKAISLDRYKPTATNSAKAYIPLISLEEYLVKKTFEYDVDADKLIQIIIEKEAKKKEDQ